MEHSHSSKKHMYDSDVSNQMRHYSSMLKSGLNSSGSHDSQIRIINRPKDQCKLPIGIRSIIYSYLPLMDLIDKISCLS